MGVVQTSELYKGFIFDGIDSKGFGVYITGSGVYNAPEREVEMIDIPGRNGSYILDKGRFHNITVTYPAGMFGDAEGDFAEGIRKLRNALASRKGYCKLIDEYHPLEYRMASYKGGLEVEPAAINGEILAGQFNIVFDCMPQRFLIDGDNPVEVSDGGDIFNPTLFDARPLLQVWGYGDISINGETISIDDTVIGEFVMLTAMSSGNGRLLFDIPADKLAVLNSGDDITATVTIESEKSVRAPSTIRTATATVASGTATASAQIGFDGTTSATAIRIPLALSYGTPSSFEVRTNITLEGFDYLVGSFTDEWYERTTITYDGDATIRILSASGATSVSATSDLGSLVSTSDVIGNSTKSVLGEPLYFDMDIGEAYKIEGGEFISVNNAVSFPAELPVLRSGANAITFDDTVTKLEIVPRWWEV